MALHPDFPKSPYVILDPDIRWFPAPEKFFGDNLIFKYFFKPCLLLIAF